MNHFYVRFWWYPIPCCQICSDICWNLTYWWQNFHLTKWCNANDFQFNRPNTLRRYHQHCRDDIRDIESCLTTTLFPYLVTLWCHILDAEKQSAGAKPGSGKPKPEKQTSAASGGKASEKPSSAKPQTSDKASTKSTNQKSSRETLSTKVYPLVNG